MVGSSSLVGKHPSCKEYYVVHVAEEEQLM